MVKIRIDGAVATTGRVIISTFNVPPAWDTITGSLGSTLESQGYSVTPGATDQDTFPDPSITYSVSAGILPSGLSITASTGEISGTPDAVGSDTLTGFTLRAADGTLGQGLPGKSTDRDFSITVIDDNPPVFDISSLSLGSVAEGQNTTVTIPTITATDNNTLTQTITFSEVTSTLTDENLSIDTNTGIISGVPGTTGGTRTLAFTLRASTPTNSVDRNYEIIVTDNQDPVWVTDVGLLATVDENVAIDTITVEATDENTVSYSVTSGELPDGLSLNSSTGDITGTPDEVTSDTTFDFEITATDTVESDFTARCFAIKVLDLISNSLRFNDNDSAIMTRTPSSASNRDTWTWSGWIKWGSLPSNTMALFAGGADFSNFTRIQVRSDKILEYSHTDAASTTDRVATTAAFRDPSAWQHIVVSVDTTDGTEANRVKLYINGIQLTGTDLSTADYPSQNVDTDINTTNTHSVGARMEGATFFDGYMAEVNFVDGSQLAASDFGTFNSNGDWQPKVYSGGYGTNGFHLDFAVAPGTGNGGGTDVSGNANHFTDSGLAANDQVSDSPTNNYCVLNPLDNESDGTLSDGNLRWTVATGVGADIRGTFSLTSGKWYWESTITDLAQSGVNREFLGVFDTQEELPSDSPGDNFTNSANGYGYGAAGDKRNNASTASYGTAFVENDVISVAFDADNGTIWFANNGTWQNSATQGEIEAGTTTNAAYSSMSTANGFSPCISGDQGSGDSEQLVNFGQLGFAHTVPSGYLAINSANLSTPTIADPGAYFNTALYIGNGSATSRTITGVGFQPDFVWKTSRADPGDNHWLHDSVRGATKGLNSNLTSTETTSNRLTAFAVDGFTFAISDPDTNNNGENYVSWNWKEGSTPGFDIVAYSGTGSAHTEAHSLSATPKLIIVKERTDDTGDWFVYHEELASDPETDYILFNDDVQTVDDATIWNDTAPTSSVFSVGTHDDVNGSSDTYIAYLWAEVDGFSKFGSYTGNGSSDGPFVWCGFRPAYVITKGIDVNGNWNILDSTRSTANPVKDRLSVQTTTGEDTARTIDFLSNGFKLRESGTDNNGSGNSYIFMAFAESPFKTARAR